MLFLVLVSLNSIGQDLSIKKKEGLKNFCFLSGSISIVSGGLMVAKPFKDSGTNKSVSYSGISTGILVNMSGVILQIKENKQKKKWQFQ
jgi:hypothetical protein